MRQADRANRFARELTESTVSMSGMYYVTFCLNILPRAGDYLPLFFWEIRSVTLKTNVLRSIEK